MTWKEERDALIAQTMAFVQSVTGKPADFSKFEVPAIPVAPPVASQQAPTSRAASIAAQPTAAKPGDQEFPVGDLNGVADPAPAESYELAKVRGQESPALQSPAAQTGSGPGRFTSIASQLDLQRDMQAEIRARVARFRAHQERFNRERQEYFSATLARLKATAEGTVLPEE
ncbi:conserved protein of unknown function [Bradyrhizobium sp. ORS 285]|uniref:hypothetical protein n=1 Tax=Bradyrhizobium sp. ORS 285 TaxID=115808 RepID=UPI0002409AA7|nr:hypothetical protein [Bradyrhizobium sp. ORS 285]CCD87568.1 conserved hypothetical protein [Bradyrhizobium sp. ORS 285]SMX57805.1 conserved protein of unknown function [Bradyrhizobium sp. ORS 285]